MKLLRVLPRFRAAQSALSTLAERECWSRDKIDAWQLARLNAIWSHALRHVPHYRQLAASHKLPSEFGSWAEFESQVPVLAKDVVRRSPDSFLSEQAERGSWTLTGGSTGTPMRIYWAHRDHREILQAKYRFHDMWGVGMLDRTAFVWGRAASRPSGWRGMISRFREQATDFLRSRLRISAYNLSDADLNRALRRIERFRPTMLYGFSQALHLLALAAKRESFHCESLKLCVLTAEPVNRQVQQIIADAFGVPTALEYGATECELIAYQSPAGPLLVREDLVRVETLPRDDGRYEIVLTVLANRSFPLLRYSIGDVTDAPLHVPEQGFASLQDVSGRDDDLLVARSGGYLHPARIDAVFESGDYPSVVRFQVRQGPDGAVRLILQSSEPLSSKAGGQLHAELAELLGGFPVSVEVVDSIVPAASGKHRTVQSDLARLRREEAGDRRQGTREVQSVIRT
jgi:phenylacetate-CoA ligase